MPQPPLGPSDLHFHWLWLAQKHCTNCVYFSFSSLPFPSVALSLLFLFLKKSTIATISSGKDRTLIILSSPHSRLTLPFPSRPQLTARFFITTTPQKHHHLTNYVVETTVATESTPRRDRCLWSLSSPPSLSSSRPQLTARCFVYRHTDRSSGSRNRSRTE